MWNFFGKKRKTLILVFFAILILTAVGFFYPQLKSNFNKEQVFAAGESWLTGWSYRKPITITNSSGGALTDYQIKVVVAYNAHIQTDFDDIRFTDSGGSTELSYWIESKTDSSTATFWVKVSSIPTSTSTIYVYYGNAGVSTTSNGDDTFALFDDFPGTSLDGAKWTNLLGRSVTVSGSICTIAMDASPPSGISSIATFGTGYAMRSRATPPSSPTAYGLGFASATKYAKVYGPLTSVTWNTTTEVKSFPYVAGYRIYEVRRNASTNIKFYANDALVSTHTVQIPTDSESVKVTLDQYNSSLLLDWVVVRKVVETEPTNSLGTEETPPAVNGSCGTAKGHTYLYSDTDWPPYTLCATGTPTAGLTFPVPGGGAVWTCYGSNGGTNDDTCSAVRTSTPVNGACGTADTHGYYQTADIDTAAERCSAGTFTSFTDNGSSWSWGCGGTGGGTTATCNANKVACGTYHNTVRRDEPATNLCQYGTNTTVTLAGTSWLWSCTNSPGTDAGCYTYKTTCGSANGATYSFPPTINLCATNGGTASSVTTGATTYTWTCTGSDSLAVNCSANKAGGGWVAEWNYRKPVTVADLGIAITDYQIKVVVPWNSNMQADFDDIRFTSNDGSTELSYWMESKTDSTTATFWVKVSSVPVGGTSIYMYYGNASVATTSNGDNTFIFFDDFPGSSLDTATKWTVVTSTGTPTVSVSNSKLTFTCDSTDEQIRYRAKYGTTSQDTITMAKMSVQTSSGGDSSIRLLSDNLYAHTFGYNSTPGGTLVTRAFLHEGVAWGSNLESSLAYNTDYVLETRYNPDADLLYARRDFGSWASWARTVNPTTFVPYIAAYSGTSSVIAGSYNWVAVRKYFTTDPTTTIGTEESNNGVCGSADGSNFSSAPTVNLCSGGTASVVSGSGPWTWTCTGNGITDSCSANKIGGGWLPGWDYRERIDITNTGSALTDYQIEEVIPYNAHMQPDFDDIRFTSGDGSTEINYWLELKTDSTSATFWVEVPSIPTGGTSIYVYYGNASAETTSDGDDTFILFDHFLGSTLDAAKWTSSKWGSATLTISSSLASLYSPTGNSNNQYIRSVQTFDAPVVLETRYRQNATRYYGEIGFATSTNPTYPYLPGGNHTEHMIAGGYSQPSNLVTQVGPTNYSSSEAASTFYRGTLKMAGTSQEVLVDDAVKASRTDTMPSGAYKVHIDEVSPWNAAYQLDVDWVAARKYSATEPTGVFDSEESIPNGVCGASDGQSFYSSPSTDLCNSGTASAVTVNQTTFTWTCAGSGGGETDSCSANQSTRARPCGTYGDIDSSGAISAYDGWLAFHDLEILPQNLIDVNNNGYSDFNDVFIIDQYIDGTVGTFPICSIVNGDCGSSSGTTVTSAPTTNLCTAGSASAVSGSGPWTWTCDGSGTNHTDDSCYANLTGSIIDGHCGSANYSTVSWPPTTNLCTSGTPSAVTTDNVLHIYTWECVGANGGKTDVGVANMSGEVINGICGSADGTPISVMPTTNLCGAGVPSAVTGTGPWTWTCNDIGGGTDSSCSAIFRPIPKWQELSPY